MFVMWQGQKVEPVTFKKCLASQKSHIPGNFFIYGLKNLIQ
jgi:hypothetical protein